MTGRRLSLLTAVLAVVILAGCARPAEPGDTSAGAAPSVSGSAAPSGSAEPSGSAASPGPPPPSAAGALSISGKVTAGVEPNCLLLTGPGEPHLLVFTDESMRAKAKVGTRITVTGRAQPGMMTTCQQGVPFLVTSVSAA